MTNLEYTADGGSITLDMEAITNGVLEINQALTREQFDTLSALLKLPQERHKAYADRYVFAWTADPREAFRWLQSKARIPFTITSTIAVKPCTDPRRLWNTLPKKRVGGDVITLGACPACDRLVHLSSANRTGARCRRCRIQFDADGVEVVKV